MNWRDYIKSIQDSDIVEGSLESIMTNLFRIAGCLECPQSETVKSWLYGKRKCRSRIYFPKGTIEAAAVFGYFRNRSSDKLCSLQRIFENQKAKDSSNPIDVKTTDLDIFCWSLVNQFLDLLKLERVSVPQPKGDAVDVRKAPPPHDQKCCLYCVHWQGDRSAAGIAIVPTNGTCYTHYHGNRHRLQRCLSSTAACANYEAVPSIMSRLEECGFAVKDLI